MSKADSVSLVAIVVTHNRLNELAITLARLLDESSRVLPAILIVDNASTDGTSAFLAAQTDKRITVLHCDENIGGAGGFEQGMRLAVKKYDPDWMVLMDDDSRPYQGALTAFTEQKRNDAEAWAAAVYHPDGRICDMNRPSLNPFWNWRVLLRTLGGNGRDGFHFGKSEYESTAQPKIDGTSFVGFFISRAGRSRAGFPDGNLFIYGDDVLYTLTLRKRGGTIRFAPEVRFEHAFTSIQDGDKRFRPLWKSYYHYRNLLMAYRLASGPLFVLVAPAAALKWLLKVRFHQGERRAYLTYVARALKDALLSRTDVSLSDVKNIPKR